MMSVSTAHPAQANVQAAHDDLADDFLRLMRAGLTEPAVRASTAIQEAVDEDDPMALIPFLRDLIRRVQLPREKHLSRKAILVLFDEDGKIKGDLTSRRIEVAEIENLSISTVRRRQVDLADALRMLLTDSESVVSESSDRSLGGTWYAWWQTTTQGSEVHNSEVIEVRHEGKRVTLENREVSPENPLGGYLWSGRLHFADQRALIGDYSAKQGPAKGSLFYVLNATGRWLEGRWAGSNVDSDINSGLCVLARDPESAKERFEHLLSQERRG